MNAIFLRLWRNKQQLLKQMKSKTMITQMVQRGYWLHCSCVLLRSEEESGNYKLEENQRRRGEKVDSVSPSRTCPADQIGKQMLNTRISIKYPTT